MDISSETSAVLPSSVCQVRKTGQGVFNVSFLHRCLQFCVQTCICKAENRCTVHELLVGTCGGRIKQSCPSALGDKACSCLLWGETPFSLHFKKWNLEVGTKTYSHRRDLGILIGKALYFFISQRRIYDVFSCGGWNYPCRVCGNLDVRDTIISSRKNSEFVQLECAEFGKFHICILAVKGTSTSFECHISYFACAAVQDILVKTFKILILEL